MRNDGFKYEHISFYLIVARMQDPGNQGDCYERRRHHDLEATVAPDTSLAEIATLLEKRRIKRLPVLKRGRLVGIVSRSDLVHALAAVELTSGKPCPITDGAIRSLLLAELRPSGSSTDSRRARGFR